MTNANDTAFVADYQTDTQGMKHFPLTKREYFASSAPPVPDWFQGDKFNPTTPNPTPWFNIKNEDDRQLCKDWLDCYDFDLPEHLKWFQLEHEKRGIEEYEYSQNKERNRFFAWQIYYADALITALNTNQ